MLQPIKTVVADDDCSRTAISEIISKHIPFVEMVGETNSCNEAFRIISEQKPQLVFIGMEIDNGNCFELLRRFKEISFKFIIVSTNNHYAVDAFRFHASDYLIKPVNPEELINSVRKVAFDLKYEFGPGMTELSQRLSLHGTKTNPNLVISNNKGFTVLRVSDIILCEADGYCTNFYLADNSKISSSYNLKHYESILPQNHFMRVHNSFIINKEHVKSYSFQGEILLLNNLKCSLSIRHKHAFLKAFGRTTK